MKLRALGDRKVGEIGLGGANWSLGEPRDTRAAEELLTFAFGNGVTYIDTAAAYTSAHEDGHNEKLIGRVVRSSGLDIAVGTKGGHRRAGDHWYIDGRPSAIRADCEASLRALGVDHLDLYYLHKPDPVVPFAESVGAIEQLRAEGKVRLTGVSNVSPAQFREALSITPLSAVQNSFSPFDPTDLDLIRECEQAGVCYFIYSPLGGRDRPQTLAELMPRTETIARSNSLTLEQIVLAWELSLSPSVIPVVGATRKVSLANSLGATELVLSDSMLVCVMADLGLPS